MKTLARYLANYVVEEVDKSLKIEGFGPWDTGNMQKWIESGIAAYQSTENCLVNIFGGDCPDCSTPMKYKTGNVSIPDGDSMEIGIYECPECGYEIYG